MAKSFLVNIQMAANTQIIGSSGSLISGMQLGNGTSGGSASGLVTVQNFTNANLPSTSPSNGMIAYDTTNSTLAVYTSSGWKTLAIGTSTVASVAGTSNQILVNGATSAATGAVTLSFPTGGVTLPGKTTLTASTTSAAAANIPTGAVPSTPAAGDLWNVSDVLYFGASSNRIAYTNSTFTTGATWNGGVIGATYGGTGVANSGTITVSGNTVIGSSTNTVTLSTSGNTSVTLPTSGTLAILGANTFTGSQTLRAGTATAGTAPLYFTSGTNLTTAAAGAMEFDGTSLYFTPSTSRRTVAFLDGGQTFTSATWNGSVIGPAYGGTGVANGSNNTITFTGNYTLGLTLSGNTAVTLPTSGTLITTGVTSLTSLTAVGTIGTGTWQGSTIGVAYGGTGATTFTAGLVYASGTTAFATATGTQITTAIGTNAVTNATNATNTAITDDTTTNATMYPTWVTTASGNQAQKVSSSKLTFNPSTGTLATTMVTLSGTPTNATDAVTKAYADAIASGVNAHDASAYATTGALGTTGNLVGGTITTTYANGTSGVGATLTIASSSNWTSITIDGQSLTVGDRVLIKDQATALQNGIYTVTQVGTTANSTSFIFTRATDSDAIGELGQGDLTYIVAGTNNGGSSWVQTAVVTTVGTSSITWSQFAGVTNLSAGAGLVKNGNAFDVGVVSGDLVANADSVGLASVTTTATTNQVSGTFIQSLTTDGKGRLTAYSSGTHTLALADGSTKGIAAFSSTGFSASSGVISFASGTTTQTDANVSGGAYTYATQKQSARITGTGSASSFTVKHNFGNTNYVAVQVVEVSSGNEVEVDITRGNGQVTIAMASAPALNTTYDVVIVG